jgi:ferric-dicitrate binding protein FerR (iron transport regulator)
MKDTEQHINCLLDKYISGNYNRDELERLLASLKGLDSREFDAYAEPVWKSLPAINREESEEEISRYRAEVKKIIQRHGRQRRIGTTKVKYLLRTAAAIALLALVTAAAYWLRSAPEDTEIQLAQVSAIVRKGQKQQLALNDGSQVFLNSESRLSYPEAFAKNKRDVELSGEAFFKIEPDKDRVFSVKTAGVTVKVLGTSFNVKNYDSDNFIAVTVVSGKVSVTVNDNDIKLLPDEQLYINKNTGEFGKNMVQADKYIQWNRGTLFFNQTPLKEVVTTLERWYNVNIQMDGESLVRITGEHDNKSLAAVLESICFTTGMKYSKKDHDYILFHP